MTCSVTGPEGQSIGLVNGLAAYTKINEYGFLETPYKKVVDGKVTDQVVYLMADEEEKYYIAEAVEPLNDDRSFKKERVICRKKGVFEDIPASKVDVPSYHYNGCSLRHYRHD